MKKKRGIKKELEPTVGDYTHAGVRAGLSMAPILGGFLTEFFSMVIAPPLEKRRDEWLIEIFKRLIKLEREIDGFKIENLQKNENFISVLLSATQIAMRTHQEEKLEALRNTVINSTLGNTATAHENFQQIFLNIIDRYTPLHLLILRFIENPTLYISTYRGVKTNELLFSVDLMDAFKVTFSELHCIDEYYEQITRDLSSDGLIKSEKIPNRTKMGKPRITQLGRLFLDFITVEPLKKMKRVKTGQT
jgi:hypothetical protein